MAPRAGADLREVALRLLASRDHSREELRRKLLARGVEPADMEPVLDRLADLGYLDDTRFARQYVASRARRGIGRARLVEELVSRGVARSAALQVVGEADLDDEVGRAAELARQRASQGRGRDQTARFLLRRGFPAAVVRAVVARVFDHP